MLWAVIMAGGSGTRFWPESRAGRPKQFLKIFGRKTLIEQTVDRLKPVIPSSRVIVITNEQHTGLVKKLLKISPSHIVGEPVGRNTAPCAVLAAQMIFEKDPEGIIALLPSDHRITDEKQFRGALEAAGRIAKAEGMPVTFGIKPSSANTGYGYLEMADVFAREKGFEAYRLKCFHEKPDAAKAKKFLAAGNFLWNSGMFVWRADSVLKAAKEFLPESVTLSEKITGFRHCEEASGRRGNLKTGIASVAKIKRLPRNDGKSFTENLKRFYKDMPNISIDYGLMEKLAGKILTLPIDIGWHDLGGWLAFEELWEKDTAGNASQGPALIVDSANNVVKATGKRMIALLGVKDLVVVDTEDAILVCPKDKTESIRQIVQALKDKKLAKYL